MTIKTESLEFDTNGYTHIINLSEGVNDLLSRSGLSEGQVLISAIGSTTGITTIEFEPGLVNRDMSEMFDLFAPYSKSYLHNQTWGDDNGAAHLRSALTGTSLTIPFINQRLILGTWQQIVFIDFDTRPRKRKVIVQLMGE